MGWHRHSSLCLKPLPDYIKLYFCSLSSSRVFCEHKVGINHLLEGHALPNFIIDYKIKSIYPSLMIYSIIHFHIILLEMKLSFAGMLPKCSLQSAIISWARPFTQWTLMHTSWWRKTTRAPGRAQHLLRSRAHRWRQESRRQSLTSWEQPLKWGG